MAGSKKVVWFLVSCLMIVALILASCAPSVTEEEEVVEEQEEEEEEVQSASTPSPPVSRTYIVTWDDDIQITDTGAPSFYPTLGIGKNTLHIAWVDQRHEGQNREIYYNHSNDNGVTWLDSGTRILCICYGVTTVMVTLRTTFPRAQIVVLIGEQRPESLMILVCQDARSQW